MSMNQANKRKVAVAGAVLAVLTVTTILVIVFSGDHEPVDRGGSPAKIADTSPGKPGDVAQAPASGPERVLCTVHANGGGFVRLPRSTPMYIECVFTNPMKDKDMALPQIESVTPVLTNKEGAKVSVKLSPTGDRPSKAPPWGIAVLAWEIDTDLAPGTYTVTVGLPKSFPGGDASDRPVRIRPARLIVTDKPEDQQLSSQARRRLMVFKGKGQEVVSELTAGVVKDPGNRLLAMELVSILADQGKYSQSRDTLLAYLANLQTASTKVNKDKAADIPCWAAVELEFLNAKCRKTPARPVR